MVAPSHHCSQEGRQKNVGVVNRYYAQNAVQGVGEANEQSASVTSRSILRQCFVWSFRVAIRSLIWQYSTAHRSSASFLCLIAAWILASSLNRVMTIRPTHYRRHDCWNRAITQDGVRV